MYDLSLSLDNIIFHNISYICSLSVEGHKRRRDSQERSHGRHEAAAENDDGCILPFQAKAEHKEMHPRCCLPTGGRSPQPAKEQPQPSVARVLYKWTNIAKGWRPRFFCRCMIPRRSRIRLIGSPLGFLHLKVLNADTAASTCEPRPNLMEPECYGSAHDKSCEGSNTESSDHVGQQEFRGILDQDYYDFDDTRESFSDSAADPDLNMKISNPCKDNCLCDEDKCIEPRAAMGNGEFTPLHFKRRTKLPEPVQKEKGVSLWSMIKDNVGKDLTQVCLPVYFNEPLSSLQKCFEDLEYSYLLDRAYECGLKGNSLMRTLYVASFAVSGYASTDGRPCKPFNPLLGETYEADYPEKGIRFFSEKVSHHPMVMACHCEGKGWKFWGDSTIKSKFWGQTLQLDPVGVLTIEFDDGETFRWNKVTTTINNLIIGRVYCHHHGTMDICGNKEYSCKLTFKHQSFLDRNPRQVQGFVKDVNGATVATLRGNWDEKMYCTTTTTTDADVTLLWQKSEPSANPTRYNLTSFAITLNELTPGLKEKLPPTDSRLRPDQQHLENGEYDKANAEKLRLETRQRMARKVQENGWKPRWFQRDSEDQTFRYTGGYWEAREQGKWNDCHHIFGESSESCNFLSTC